MKVLALETATGVCGAAIVEDGTILAESSIVAERIHSEKLLPMIDDVLRQANVDLSGMDGIAVSIGPGSFTGLRISLSAAKGLAYASGKPLLAVPTLEALAWSCVQKGLVRTGDHILPMIDARREEVYAALYYYDDQPREQISARALHLHEIDPLLESKERIIITGNGVEKFQKFVAITMPGLTTRFVAPAPEDSRCSASAVGSLGEHMLLRGEIADLASLGPLYVKDFQTIVGSQHQSEVQS